MDGEMFTKVKWKSREALCEAAAAGFEYCMTDSKGNALHGPVQCKDYFTDAGWTEHLGGKSQVYGFKWEQGKMGCWGADWHYMAMRHKTVKLTKAMAANLEKFMHLIEEAQNFPLSKVHAVEDNNLVTIYSKAWWERPYLISAFTQFIRLGETYEGGDIVEFITKMGTSGGNPVCSYDNYRLKDVAARLKLMMTGRKWKQKYEDYKEAYSVHNGGGFLSFDISKF